MTKTISNERLDLLDRRFCEEGLSNSEIVELLAELKRLRTPVGGEVSDARLNQILEHVPDWWTNSTMRNELKAHLSHLSARVAELEAERDLWKHRAELQFQSAQALAQRAMTQEEIDAFNRRGSTGSAENSLIQSIASPPSGGE